MKVAVSSNRFQAFVRSREATGLSLGERPRSAHFSGKAAHRSVYSHSGGPFVVRTATETPPDVLTHDSTETLNWFKHWWPVQIVSNLETDRPNRIQLLGEYFAVWKSKSGEWVAMRDMCPHRLAPLSEGRVEDDGTLMCSYHGWRFDESGKCAKIPQADDQKSHESACTSPRSCAATYPCKARGGFFWIWPDSSETRFLDASAASLGLTDEYADYLEGRVQEGYSAGFTSIVPYGYDVLMENVTDPSHFPFSHHGSSPAVKRSDGGPINMKAVVSDSPGPLVRIEYTRLETRKVVLEVKDLSSVFYTTTNQSSDESPSVLFVFSTPVTRSMSRLFLSGISPGALSKKNRGFSFFRLFLKICPWYLHLNNMTILDGDNVFLHAQDYYLRNSGSQEWRPRNYFTPAASDLAVMLFRKWFHTKGNGGPFKDSEEQKSGLLPRRQLLDRYRFHVSECKLCQRALAAAKRAVSVCKLVSRVSLVLIGALLCHGMQHGALVKWRIAAGALACALFFAVQRVLEQKFIPQFYFKDYIHAEKN